MTDRRKRVLIFLVLLIFSVGYFFVFSKPLSKELVLKPVWQIKLDKLESSPFLSQSNEIFSFNTNSFYGYFSKDGKLLYSFPSDDNVSLSNSSFTKKDGDAYKLLRPDMTIIGQLDAFSPFFSKGMLFSGNADGTALSSYSENGNKLFTYHFPNQVSAFSATKNIIVAGMLDGWIEALSPTGTTLATFFPGGSRLPVILGVDASNSGNLIALVSGIDKQRLVVLEKGVNDYRVKSHKYLDDEFREPVRIIIMDDEENILYRRSDGIGVWSSNGKVDTLIPVKCDDFVVSDDNENNVSYITSRRGKKNTITVFKKPATLLGLVPLSESISFVSINSSSVFAGSNDWLVRLDFVED